MGTGMRVEVRKKLTGRKREESAERKCRLKKALSLRTGDAPEGINEPADQQCII